MVSCGEGEWLEVVIWPKDHREIERLVEKRGKRSELVYLSELLWSGIPQDQLCSIQSEPINQEI